MRQLAGTKTRYRRAHAAPLTGLISDRAEYKSASRTVVLRFVRVADVQREAFQSFDKLLQESL